MKTRNSKCEVCGIRGKHEQRCCGCNIFTCVTCVKMPVSVVEGDTRQYCPTCTARIGDQVAKKQYPICPTCFKELGVGWNPITCAMCEKTFCFMDCRKKKYFGTEMNLCDTCTRITEKREEFVCLCGRTYFDGMTFDEDKASGRCLLCSMVHLLVILNKVSPNYTMDEPVKCPCGLMHEYGKTVTWESCKFDISHTDCSRFHTNNIRNILEELHVVNNETNVDIKKRKRNNE